MKNALSAGLLAILCVSACSSPHSNEADVSATASPDRQAAAPKIAYSFDYRFDLPDSAITAAQDRHLAMCDKVGLQRCRMIEMHRSNGDGGTDASLKLEVENSIARPFGANLSAPVVALGGSLTSTDISAQDLARDIADLETTATGNGADATTARTQLARARNQVATSAITIAYSGTTSFSSETGRAFASVGSTLTYSVVALIYFAAAVVPWVLLGLLLFFAIRALRRRWRRRPEVIRAAGQPTP